MNKSINMKLSAKDITKTIKKLEKLKKDLSESDEEMVRQLSELGLNEIEQNYASTGYQDGNEDVSFFEKGSKKKKIIGVTGTQVLYDEFGTGTKGEESPHPNKNEYGLNPYNSGKTIRQNNSDTSNATNNGIPVGGLYWTFNYNGQKKYTNGIPAGKQVFNAAKKLQKEKEKIKKKVVGDALSKL